MPLLLIHWKKSLQYPIEEWIQTVVNLFLVFLDWIMRIEWAINDKVWCLCLPQNDNLLLQQCLLWIDVKPSWLMSRVWTNWNPGIFSLYFFLFFHLRQSILLNTLSGKESRKDVTKEGISENIKFLIEFFMKHNCSQYASAQILKNPSNKQVEDIVNCMLNTLDSSLNLKGQYAENFPIILKGLGYTCLFNPLQWLGIPLPLPKAVFCHPMHLILGRLLFLLWDGWVNLFSYTPRTLPFTRSSIVILFKTQSLKIHNYLMMNDDLTNIWVIPIRLFWIVMTTICSN